MHACRSTLEDPIGTGSSGLQRLKDGRFTVLSIEEGLPSSSIRVVMEDRAGRLWIGTDGGGLSRLDGGVWSYLTLRDGLLGDDVSSLLETGDGSLLIGTYGNGMNRLKDGTLSAFTPRGGLTNAVVRVLFEDREGRLWIGTNGGVNRLEGGTVTQFTTREGLSNDLVMSIFQDRSGAVWVGTYGGGINRIDDGKVTAYTTRDGLSSDNVHVVFEDDGGGIWVGTEGGGLCRMKDGAFVACTSKNGLFDDTVFHALDDGRGDLWLSCNKGIFRLAKQQLYDFADGKRSAVSCTAYGTADGMRSAECSGGPVPGAWRMRDGRLCFATVKGLVVVDPSDLRENAAPPPVLVEEVVADGAAIGRVQDVELLPGTHTVEFHYTALSFLVPERVRFRYKLEGFDGEWIDAGTRRTAYYTNLPHGSYTFRVMACNNDGVWNEAGAGLPFALQPRFYETWAFYLLCGLGGALVVVGGFRARVYQLKARERELIALVNERTRSLRAEKERTEAERAEAERQRERAEEANRAKSVFLASMSHELRTPLNAVIGFAQLMDRDDRLIAEHRASVTTIMRSGEHLLELINDVLSLSKIEAGKLMLVEKPFDLCALLQAVEGIVRGRAQEKRLEVVFELDPGLPRAVRGDEGKLRQVLINLLGNAVKFTDRGRVTLRARWRSGRGQFEVEDTGRGIAQDELGSLFESFVQTETGRASHEGTGLGLVISRRIVQLMGGDIAVASTPRIGTTFSLEVDLPEAAEAADRGDRRTVVGLAAGQAPPRILVVDDTPENRLLLVKLLESTGFEVREAASGAEAVEVWGWWHPNLIFMDMRMPVMDGREATRRIRKEESVPPAWNARPLSVAPPLSADPTPEAADLEQRATDKRSTPAERTTDNPRCVIIALTASAFEHERDDILASGADDVVTKPFRVDAIFGTLGKYLGVRYRYAEESDIARPGGGQTLGSLAALTAERRRELLDALRLGDMDEAVLIAERIREEHEEIGSALAAAVRAFRLDEILARLEEVDAADA